MMGGVAKEDVDAWFISHEESGGGIVYLRVDGRPGAVISVVQGEVGGPPCWPW